jgi:hypothetical protein
MPHRVTTATGSAAALATALMLDDLAAFEALLPGLPPLPVVLADAASLLRDAAYASLSLALGSEADDIDVRRAWEDSRDLIVCELTLRHDLDSPELPAAVGWLGEVLAGGSWLPAHSWTLHLALAVLFVAEMFGGGFCEHWPAFLLSRELART